MGIPGLYGVQMCIRDSLYSLQSIPLVKRLLPDSLYASPGLKVFANVISILLEIGSFFLGKALYLLLMVFLAAGWMKSAAPDAFVHIFFFLTLTGGLLNTHIFNPTKDKYCLLYTSAGRKNARKVFGSFCIGK